jgi:raffinose/stachyose/melibiose transport system substrate-binding protein
MIRRDLRVLAAPVVLALLVGACSAGSPSQAPTVGPASAPPATTAPSEAVATPAPTPTAAPEPVTLTVWWLGYGEGQTNAAQQAMDAYHAAHPEVTIDLSFYNYQDYSNAMPAALAAGNPPDFVYGDPTAPNAPNYVKAGQVVDLGPIVKERGWEDRLQPGVITFYNPLYGGGTYGVPLASALRGILYNKTILNEVGGTVPKTLDELDALLAKVKAAGYTPLAMGDLDKYGADYYWLNLALAYLAPGDWQSFRDGVMTHKSGVPWGGDAVRAGMTKFLEWRDKGYFNDDYASINSDDPNPGFMTGKTFAVSNGANLNAGIIAAKVPFDVGFMNWPRIDPSAPQLVISDPGNILQLPKDSKHPDQALDVMDYLLTPEVGQIMATNGLIPLQKLDLSTVTLPEPFIKDELTAAGDQTPVGWLNYMAPFEFPDRQGSELQKLLAGKTTLDAYMTFLQKTYDAAIAAEQ